MKIIQFFIVTALIVGLFSVSCLASDHCFGCHDESSFEQPYTHAPVAKNNCIACHNPHLAKHEGLLHHQGSTLCFGCHTTWVEQQNKVSYPHQPVAKGNCNACHDPHGSQTAVLLKQSMAVLCLSCHSDTDQKNGTIHQPFAQGQCTACHTPHGSNRYALLKEDGTKLCLGCHTNQNELRKKHLNRKMDQMNCLECHNPHHSKDAELIRENTHEPFTSGKCSTCHNQQKGIKLCLSCHPEVMQTFNQPINHVTNDKEHSFCFNCHTPHASQQKGLILGSPGEACRNCHEGKFERRNKSLHVHPNAQRCVDCHQLHGSNKPAMLKQDSEQACLNCHENHSNFSHPTGDKAHDPRNGQPMNCISCHDPCNGTMFKYNLRGTSDKGLCIQCHAGY